MFSNFKDKLICYIKNDRKYLFTEISVYGNIWLMLTCTENDKTQGWACQWFIALGFCWLSLL
jgi:hypothetical protein